MRHFGGVRRWFVPETVLTPCLMIDMRLVSQPPGDETLSRDVTVYMTLRAGHSVPVSV